MVETSQAAVRGVVMSGLSQQPFQEVPFTASPADGDMVRSNRLSMPGQLATLDESITQVNQLATFRKYTLLTGHECRGLANSQPLHMK